MGGNIQLYEFDHWSRDHRHAVCDTSIWSVGWDWAVYFHGVDCRYAFVPGYELDLDEADYTVTLLIRCTDACRRRTYQGVMYHCYGKIGTYAISVFQFVFAYGGMLVFREVISLINL